MKKWIAILLLCVCCSTGFAQKINGQWRGYFNSNGDIVLTGSENTEYVLEIEVNGTEITGYSYSYFSDRKYYVICSLSGTYYKSTKSMKITETARIKGLTPPDWTDCLQTHILTYEKEGNTEELAGKWVTAPGQLGTCGSGLTTLTRRTISKDLSSYNKSKTTTATTASPFSSPKPVAKAPATVDKIKKPTTPSVKAPAKPKTETEAPVAKNKLVERDTPETIVPEKKITTPAITVPLNNFEKRSSDVVKTIEINNGTFKVDLYDNGDIDGDSISLFYNNRLIISHKKLTDKAISVTLDASINNETNELTMYAENLGSIPPNTALMVITDGDKRYEVRIASDLKKSGTIRFVHRPKIQ